MSLHSTEINFLTETKLLQWELRFKIQSYNPSCNCLHIMLLNISFTQIDAFIGYNANMMSEENVIRVELKSTTIKGSAV
jgi:hypothetical protein